MTTRDALFLGGKTGEAKKVGKRGRKRKGVMLLIEFHLPHISIS